MVFDIGNTIKDGFMGRKGWLTIGDVEISASLQEIHGLHSEPTEHAVETGADITDHVRKQPQEVQITGIVSDVQLQNDFPGQTTVEAFRVDEDSKPHLEAWETVKGYFEDSRLITIVTALQTYENMILTSFTATRDKAETGVLRFSCTARKIKMVSTSLTDAINLPEPLSEVAQKKKEAGQKQNEKAGESKTEKTKAKRSSLKTLLSR